MTAWGAGLVYFANVFAAGYVLGTIRTLFLTPQFGAFTAVLIELPVILAFSWWVCGVIIKALHLPPAWASPAIMGGSAFALLIMAEAGLAALLGGQTVRQFAASLATPPGAAGLAGQVLFAIFPLLQARRPSI